MKNSRINYNRITPLHLRANGRVENLCLISTKYCVLLIRKKEIGNQHFITIYWLRASPNISTKVPPALLLNNKISRTKTPTVNHEIDKGVHQKLEAHNKIMKDKMKKYFNNRYQTKNRQIHIRDRVLVKQPRLNKLTSPVRSRSLFC